MHKYNMFYLLQVDSVAEGEAQRYFDHALTLRNAILFLRYNKNLGADKSAVPPMGLGECSVTVAVISNY